MNRSDLIREVSHIMDLPENEIEKVLDQTLQTILEALASGEAVVIKNFGRFETRERAPTIRRNPRSGIDIKVPRKRGVLFKPAPALKESVQREETY